MNRKVKLFESYDIQDNQRKSLLNHNSKSLQKNKFKKRVI